jgi:hypothetical protein
MKNTCKILSRRLKERDHSQNIGVDRWKILKWTIKKQDVIMWVGLV